VSEQDSFEERLRQAQARRGTKPGSDGQLGLPRGNWGVGFRAGVEIVSALIVGIGIGWFLDRWLGTFPWLFLVFFVLGSAAGVMNVYRLFAPRRRP
jgi:ATP synthase protein I